MDHHFGCSCGLQWQPTPLSYLPDIAHQLRATFNSGMTKPVEFRLKTLERFYWMCVVISGPCSS